MFVASILYFVGKVKEIECYAFLFSFGLLGGVLGISSGASRTPIIGDILPAVLTVIATLITYSFSRDSVAHYRKMIPFCVILLLVSAYFGLICGSSIIRKHCEEYDKDYAKRMLKYEKVEIEIEKAEQLYELNLEYQKKILKLNKEYSNGTTKQ